MTYRHLLALMFCFCAAALPAGAAAAPRIERIEPPHWWVGMKHPKLQLLVHGERIADFTPALDHPGVRIAAVTRLASPNYLFVDLEIAPDAAPGTLELSFRNGRNVLRQAYMLQAREPGSAERRSFGPQDAILNFVPDRFANGDPANDDLPGFHDKARRSDDQMGRHGGDIQGIVNMLDYIRDMGYTMIWPTPLTENNQKIYSYHGYGTTDFYKIDARFGSNEDYRRMVQAAKAKGIGVILDLVLNHLGSEHWWMRDLPSRDWVTQDGRFVPTEHYRTSVSDPYASQADRDNFTQGWFTDDKPDFNQRNPLVATYLIQNGIWWMEYAGLAGIRVDTYGYSDTAFLAEWSRRTMLEYPKLNIVGEEWSSNPLVVAYWLRGRANADGFVSHTPGMIDFPLHDALRRALVAPKDNDVSGMGELYAALVNDRLYPEPSKMVLFEGNHDVPRIFSVLGEDLALWKMAMVYVATMPRTPQFYYGTEVLMTSPTQRDDGATRRDFPGGWPGDKVNAVSGAGLTAQQKEAQAFLRKLLNWRKSQPVVHSGQLMHYAPLGGTYVYFRHDGQRKVMVALNRGRSPARLAPTRFHEMLAGHESGTDVFSGEQFDLRKSITVPARSVLLLELK
ncbi:MAG: glycoside hydrolase family 13 protein [Pseudomonadota bacterium]